MTPRPKARTEKCGSVEASKLLAKAKTWLEQASFLNKQDQPSKYGSMIASHCVSAAICASDAACCHSLGCRSKGPDHKIAGDFLHTIEPDGPEVAKKFKKLISTKSSADYGFGEFKASEVKTALRQAAALVAFAEQTLAR